MNVLYCQSAFSFNGSLWTLDGLLEAQAKQHYPAVLVDRNMHGALAFYLKAQARQMPVVLGLEVRVESALEEPLTALLFARNQKGYQGLLNLATIQASQGALELQAIERFESHLSVVLIPDEGGLASPFSRSLEDIMTPWLSLSHLYLPQEARFEPFDRPRLSTQVCRYQTTEDKAAYDTLRQILNLPPNSKDAFLDPAPCDPLVERFLSEHVLTLHFPQAHLPQVPLPKGANRDAYLEALASKGLERRLAISQGQESVYKARLKKELTVIQSLGFTDYFLLVWDLMKEAKRAGILVGPGRGSAPGSLVAYALGITHVDPIQHGLLFERFLNQARQTMPDIDIDFPDDTREHMIRYALKTYGYDHVALLSTFGTFLKRSALKDTARVLNIEERFVKEMSSLLERFDSVSELIKSHEDVKNRMARYAHVDAWLSIAARLEGLPRHVSTHAAGVILSKEPLHHYTALTPGIHDMMATQSGQKECETLGLLKIDFLGLRNLTLIQRMLDDVNQHRKKPLDLYRLPLDDEKTYRALQEGSTTGLFQLESEGMRRLVKRMKMRVFDDIAVVLALYRPGPMESIETFLKRRHEGEPLTSIEPSVDAILASTQGILLYQEQIMAIATTFAGYRLEEADLLRRAVSKKDRLALEEERARFVQKARAKRKPEKLANDIYDYIVRFADYGFNKSHSVAYAMVAYWMAYLKAHHPASFIGVMMMQALQNEKLLKHYIHEAYQLQLTLEGPSIHESEARFVKDTHALIYPFIGIKGLGKETVEALLQERAKAPFKDYVDFLRRVKHTLNVRQIESLIYAGALQSFGHTQRTLVENLEAMRHYVDYQLALEQTQFVLTPYEEYDAVHLMEKEREVLGINLRYHPLNAHQKWLKHPDVYLLDDLNQLTFHDPYTFLVWISSARTLQTKHDQTMAFIQCEGRVEQLEGVLFPKAFATLDQALQTPCVALIKAKLEVNRGKTQLVIERLKPLSI